MNTRHEVTLYPAAGGTVTVRRADADSFTLSLDPPILRLTREELWRLTEELDRLATRH